MKYSVAVALYSRSPYVRRMQCNSSSNRYLYMGSIGRFYEVKLPEELVAYVYA